MSNAFRLNEQGLKELALSTGVRDALKSVAEKGAEIARGMAQDFRVTGDYADSFEVSEETIIDFAGEGPRAAARLANTSGHAAAVEFGYKGRSDAESSSAHRVLGRTLGELEAGS